MKRRSSIISAVYTGFIPLHYCQKYISINDIYCCILRQNAISGTQIRFITVRTQICLHINDNELIVNSCRFLTSWYNNILLYCISYDVKIKTKSSITCNGQKYYLYNRYNTYYVCYNKILSRAENLMVLQWFFFSVIKFLIRRIRSFRIKYFFVANQLYSWYFKKVNFRFI